MTDKKWPTAYPYELGKDIRLVTMGLN